MEAVKKFRLDITLQDLSSFAIATHFWNQPASRAKIKEFFSTALKKICESKNNSYLKNWDGVMDDYVSKNFSRKNVPEDHALYIEDRINLLKRQILYWGFKMFEVHNQFTDDFNLTEKLQWTDYGTIDEVKTFQWVLKNNPETFLMSYACLYVQEDYIKQDIDNMCTIIQLSYLPQQVKNLERKPNVIISMYLCWYYGRELPIGPGNLYKSIRQSKSPNSELFKIALELGFVRLAKYYYFKIKDVKEREKITVEGAQECIKICQFKELDGYRKEKIAELLIFLINTMKNSEKLIFIPQNLRVMLELFTGTWPYQILFLPILNFVWPKLTKKNHTEVADLILARLLGDSMFRFYADKKTHERILEGILKISGAGLIPKQFYLKENVIKSFTLYHFSTLRLIYNDLNDLKPEHMKDFLELAMPDLKYAENGKFEIVNRYASTLCMTENEKKKFIKHLDNHYFPELINNFIKKGQFDFFEKFLNWRYQTEEEKFLFKKSLLTSNPNQKFKNWYFNDFTEEKNNVQNALYKSISSEIFSIWGKTSVCGAEFAEKKCLQFLQMYFKNDEEIRSFKRKSFEKNEEFVKNFSAQLEFAGSFQTINEFLKFCQIDPENVKDIKKKIINNLDWWIWTYGVKCNKFLILDELIKWCKRRDLIGIHVNSVIGAVLCISLLKNCKHEEDAAILKLFNEWIQPFGDVSKIKLKLEEVKRIKNCKVTEKEVGGVIKLLDKLRQKNKLTSTDIKIVASQYAESYYKKDNFHKDFDNLKLAE